MTMASLAATSDRQPLAVSALPTRSLNDFVVTFELTADSAGRLAAILPFYAQTFLCNDPSCRTRSPHIQQAILQDENPAAWLSP
jgi:hypothetical protein